MDKFTRICAGTFYYEQAYPIAISSAFPSKDKSRLHTISDFAVTSVTPFLPLII
ncbi:MAG: hypothetical protein ACFNM8_04530 [Prevotella histicola]|uniref:hypothetical protein n=1 Tax=Prevotella histicola TaxID=470565 RepID=UPI0036210BD7